MEVTHGFLLNLYITVLETIPAVFCYHLLSNSKPTQKYMFNANNNGACAECVQSYL